MYVFRLWFAAERETIARAEIEPHRQKMLDDAPNQRQRDIINHHFDLAVENVAHNIHPLVILGLRKRRTK